MLKNEILEELVVASNIVYNKDLTPGKSGNLSCRYFDNGTEMVAITRTNISKGMVTVEDIITVDMKGKILEGKGTPSSETFLHLGIYNKRKEINAVVHTHSPYATGFSMSGKDLKRLEGFGSIDNPYIPRVRYSKPGSSELAKETAKRMAGADAVILENHGVVTTGVNLSEAVLLAEFIEDIAKTQFVAHALNLKTE